MPGIVRELHNARGLAATGCQKNPHARKCGNLCIWTILANLINCALAVLILNNNDVHRVQTRSHALQPIGIAVEMVARREVARRVARTRLERVESEVARRVVRTRLERHVCAVCAVLTRGRSTRPSRCEHASRL